MLEVHAAEAMTETIIFYAACAFMAWMPGLNNTNFEFFQSGVMTDATVEETTWMCQDQDAYVDSPMWVAGLDDLGNRSENSNTIIGRWEWDFDSDDNRVVDFGDFGAFASSFGKPPPSNGWNFDADGDGVVDFGDFGRFVQAFGKCNDGVRQVECDW